MANSTDLNILVVNINMIFWKILLIYKIKLKLINKIYYSIISINSIILSLSV